MKTVRVPFQASSQTSQILFWSFQHEVPAIQVSWPQRCCVCTAPVERHEALFTQARSRKYTRKLTFDRIPFCHRCWSDLKERRKLEISFARPDDNLLSGPLIGVDFDFATDEYAAWFNQANPQSVLYERVIEPFINWDWKTWTLENKIMSIVLLFIGLSLLLMSLLILFSRN